jgi:bifunctional DNase/RNase
MTEEIEKEDPIAAFRKYYGVINCVSGSSDFLMDYKCIKNINIFTTDKMDGGQNMGVLLVLDEKEAIGVPMAACSFLNINKNHGDGDLTVHNIYSINGFMTEFYGIDFLFGFVADAIGDYYRSYLLFERSGIFTCVCMKISDILILANGMDLPIFVHKNVIQKRKVNYREIQARLTPFKAD